MSLEVIDGTPTAISKFLIEREKKEKEETDEVKRG